MTIRDMIDAGIEFQGECYVRVWTHLGFKFNQLLDDIPVEAPQIQDMEVRYIYPATGGGVVIEIVEDE